MYVIYCNVQDIIDEDLNVNPTAGPQWVGPAGTPV